jgi:hypothetical protein
VTLLDLRKQVIDVVGVKNAWIEPALASQPTAYYLEDPALGTARKVINLTGGEGANPLTVKGIYRVLIEKSEALDKDSNAIVREVAERLHAQRSLAVDFDSIEVIDTQNVQLQASIEIDPIANADDVYVAILAKIANYLSPTVRFYTLEQRLAEGKTIDEVFEGSLLKHGFIDNQELLNLKRKKNLYVSDLVREIMDVKGVRMVEYVVFKFDDKFDDTSLSIGADKTPRLDIDNSILTLKKRQLPVQLDTQALGNNYLTQQKKRFQRVIDSSQLSLPQGRDRHIARYYSVLQQFPRLYGIGAIGLPSTVSEERKAQAKQLKAYLLFFDQLLANSFAQLTHLKDLFSFHSENSGNYFAANIEDSGITELWIEKNQDSRQKQLQAIFAASNTDEADTQHTADWQRKNRFVDHLLARFAEQFSDYSSFGNNRSDVSKHVLQNKLALLRTYVNIGNKKGAGFNILEPSCPDNFSGLEQLLRLKLGLDETAGEKLYVIEHALLRPITGDALQQASLLSDARSQDPYSLQLSVVFFAAAWRNNEFESFVKQVLQEEVPAHLFVYVGKMSSLEEMTTFESAYLDWQQQFFNYRTQSNQRILNAATEQSATIALRDARDRLIDLLGIGKTYPLRDLAIAEMSTVAYNMKAKIILSNSQQDVIYCLCDNKQKPLAPENKQQGNGGDLEFITPAIVDDRTFTIQATKLTSGLTNFLLQTPTVKVGLDLSLVASILNADLLLSSPTPAADDARIVDYGVKVQVAIEQAQEGVDYILVIVNGKKETAFSSAVRGDSKTIILESLTIVSEDINIQIRATKTFDKSEKKASQTNLLSTVLPLKVKANPAVTISQLAPIIDYVGTATLKIQNSQSSVTYQVMTRAIADNEFIRTATTAPVLTIAVPNQENIVLTQPSAMDFVISTDSAQQGNGADLLLNCTGLKEDSFIALQAEKTHLANDGKTTVTSVVAISQIVAILVKPDTNPALSFTANVVESILQRPIQVSGGQAGVLYEFSTLPDKQVQGLPVYFHKRDPLDNLQNKGLEQLQIGVDFAISPNLLGDRVTENPNLSTLQPELPELSQNVSLNNNAELSIRAIKAQTGVEVVFTRTVNNLLGI